MFPTPCKQIGTIFKSIHIAACMAQDPWTRSVLDSRAAFGYGLRSGIKPVSAFQTPNACIFSNPLPFCMFGTRWKSTIFELQIGYLLLPGFRSWKQNGLYPSKPPRSHPRIHVFSRMRSEGFPFIVWGSGGWTLVRLEWLVGSASRRRRVGVLSSSRR